eukprot:6591662-Karenia_brevis.AAC.1
MAGLTWPDAKEQILDAEAKGYGFHVLSADQLLDMANVCEMFPMLNLAALRAAYPSNLHHCTKADYGQE